MTLALTVQYRPHSAARIRSSLKACTQPRATSPTTRTSACASSPVRHPSLHALHPLTPSTVTKWRTGGTLLRRIPLTSNHHLPNDAMQPPVSNPSSAVPTSIALDADWLVVGLANSRIHIFSARTGVSCRTLIGHSAGVWAVALVRAGGERVDGPDVEERMRDMSIGGEAGKRRLEEGGECERLSSAMRAALGLEQVPGWDTSETQTRRSKARPVDGRGKPSEPNGTSDGWGQPNSLVVSGGCDKDLRVWDVKSGYVHTTMPSVYNLILSQLLYLCIEGAHIDHPLSESFA